MNFISKFITTTKINKYRTFIFTLSKWILWGAIIGIVVGTTSALLIGVNDYVTEVRQENSWLVFLLPLGGVIIGYLYKYHGKNSRKGVNLILDKIHQPKINIPLIMGPLVFVATFITHLLGGSTGREGAALQMGGTITEFMNRNLKVRKEEQKILLMAGISGGFGSAFGLPLAGTLFGMEVASAGKMKYEALIPCFISSFIGNFVTMAWGIEHEEVIIDLVPSITTFTVIKVILLAIVFGIISICYSELKHHIRKFSMKYLKNPMIIGLVGGITILALVYIVGTKDYLGRSLPMFEEAFIGTVPPFAFLAKLVFTAITMGTGFRGGEVIPIFFIGATLGNVLAPIVNLPTSFLAGLGLAGVLCGAINAPITSFILAVEMFHGKGIEFFFIVCIVSYIFSWHHGIYSSQKLYEPKTKLFNLPNGESISHIKLKKRV
ncbi:H+/Cl- antiporter ClcA [Natranaerovirga pectinivora]|uniref:H+/Cl-antiporter ClcA n=1 Tax=Natranaerovirga pectinivora TaxID=682400 RepID=A0A4V2UZW5_9FIRM|nr:voltage-gated chloride channel family protein [Natranaerovirga pectinivora]TCT12971.1 H+/Cl- antiporter ClcA [Natranaerovirga pectinivora]